tara:strand:+ start:317 stop:1315 length:999 start_codon:yes stop_codon:yes gene_type:complete
MNILITGCFGFIGFNFLKEISEKYKDDFNISGIDLLDNSYSNLNFELMKSNKNYKFYAENIVNINQVNFESTNFDLIINFAAESHVDTSIYNPNVFIDSNVLGVNNLLKFCLENKIKNYIQISTDEVYGSTKDYYFEETDILNPSSVYSASKASADMICNAYARTYGLNIKTIRPANNYGPFQQPEKLIPFSISNIIENNQVEIYGDGTNIRHWLYVKDTVSGILKVIEKGKNGEIYNIGSGTYFNNNEIAKKLLSKFDLTEQSIKYVEDRPGHDFKYAVNFDKLSSLGWKPKYKFETAIDETTSWYLENQKWWAAGIEKVRKNRELRFNKN